MLVGCTLSCMASTAHSPCEKTASKRESGNRKRLEAAPTSWDWSKRKTCIFITTTSITTIWNQIHLRSTAAGTQNCTCPEVPKHCTTRQRLTYRPSPITITTHLKRLTRWRLHSRACTRTLRVSTLRLNLICSHPPRTLSHQHRPTTTRRRSHLICIRRLWFRLRRATCIVRICITTVYRRHRTVASSLSRTYPESPTQAVWLAATTTTWVTVYRTGTLAGRSTAAHRIPIWVAITINTTWSKLQSSWRRHKSYCECL